MVRTPVNLDHGSVIRNLSYVGMLYAAISPVRLQVATSCTVMLAGDLSQKARRAICIVTKKRPTH